MFIIKHSLSIFLLKNSNDASKLSSSRDSSHNNNNNEDDGFLLDKNGRINVNDQMTFDEIVMEGMLNRDAGQDEEMDGEFNADLPYGIQNVRRDLRSFEGNTRSRSTGSSSSRNIIDQVSDEENCIARTIDMLYVIWLLRTCNPF